MGVGIGVSALEVGVLLLNCLGEPVRGVKARWRFGRCRKGCVRDIFRLVLIVDSNARCDVDNAKKSKDDLGRRERNLLVQQIA